MSIIKTDFTILFQGDSITDYGRSREDDSLMGSGYANMTAAWLWAKYPEMNLKFINRGISGDRVYDLENRWSEDCVAIKPDIVSILIGINDTWRTLDSRMPSPIDQFGECYRRLLDRVKNETSARIVILEPFLLEIDKREGWREDLNPRIDSVRRVARDYGVTYVPLDGLFAAASAKQPPAFWASDGVHPTQAGHALIAQAWIEAVGL